MKVKEKDLVIGDEYWIDGTKTEKGIFVGIFPSEDDDDDISCYFHVDGYTNYLREDDGTV